MSLSFFLGKKQKGQKPVLSVEKTSTALQSHMFENSTFLGAALEEWTNKIPFNENVGVGTRLQKVFTGSAFGMQ